VFFNFKGKTRQKTHKNCIF